MSHSFMLIFNKFGILSQVVAINCCGQKQQGWILGKKKQDGKLWMLLVGVVN